jgi:hypothetical protein
MINAFNLSGVLEVLCAEIYNEIVRDLLVSDPSGSADAAVTPFNVGQLGSTAASGVSVIAGLDVRESRDGSFYVPKLTRIALTSRAEAMALMQQGLTNRTVNATEMNDHSSRSHTIMTLSLSVVSEAASKGVAPPTTFAQLNLVDLAGSERYAARHSDTQVHTSYRVDVCGLQGQGRAFRFLCVSDVGLCS